MLNGALATALHLGQCNSGATKSNLNIIRGYVAQYLPVQVSVNAVPQQQKGTSTIIKYIVRSP